MISMKVPSKNNRQTRKPKRLKRLTKFYSNRKNQRGNFQNRVPEQYVHRRKIGTKYTKIHWIAANLQVTITTSIRSQRERFSNAQNRK
jgi:hypothetical protein